MNYTQIEEYVTELVPYLLRNEITENDARNILRQVGYDNRTANIIVEGMMLGITRRLTENTMITKGTLERSLIRSLDNDPANKKNKRVKEFIEYHNNGSIKEMSDIHKAIEKLDKVLEAFIEDANDANFNALRNFIRKTFDVDINEIDKDRYHDFLKYCGDLRRANNQS